MSFIIVNWSSRVPPHDPRLHAVHWLSDEQLEGARSLSDLARRWR